MISLEGLSKARVLAALYNGSRPQGMGFLHYDPAPMGEVEAENLLNEGTYFDYLKGRVMKVDLSGDNLDPWGYDRDNGQGAAQEIIDALRKGEPEDGVTASSAHLAGKAAAIHDVRKELDTETVFDGYVTRLGLKDVADVLKPAVDAAE